MSEDISEDDLDIIDIALSISLDTCKSLNDILIDLKHKEVSITDTLAITSMVSQIMLSLGVVQTHVNPISFPAIMTDTLSELGYFENTKERTIN